MQDVESSLKVAKRRLQIRPCIALYQRQNKATNGAVVGDQLIHLLQNREQVSALLGNEHAERYIDIVIPVIK